MDSRSLAIRSISASSPETSDSLLPTSLPRDSVFVASQTDNAGSGGASRPALWVGIGVTLSVLAAVSVLMFCFRSRPPQIDKFPTDTFVSDMGVTTGLTGLESDEGLAFHGRNHIAMLHAALLSEDPAALLECDDL
jgi:hypothetical protein